MIDLNSATAAELDTVPELKGHGFEIVRYRDERGRFSDVRQLEEVPGLAGKWAGPGGRIHRMTAIHTVKTRDQALGLAVQLPKFGGAIATVS